LGYDFAGYKTDTLSGNLYSTYPSAADDTLYSWWTAHVWELRFNVNGGSFKSGTDGDAKPVTYDMAVGALPEPEYVGHEFKGWLFANGTAVPDTFKINTKYVYDSSITVYALWSANSVMLALYGDGGKFADGGGLYNKDTVHHYFNYGDVLGIMKKPQREGYDFINYYTFPQGTGTAGSIGVMYDSLSLYSDLHITRLYAHWTAGGCTLQFDVNGGDAGSITEFSRAVTYGEQLSLLPRPTRVGYDFVDWYTAADGTGVRYYGGMRVAATGVVQLYAKWVGKRLAVRFEADGYPDVGYCNSSLSVYYTCDIQGGITYGSTLDKIPVLNEPARGGLSFEGWVPSTRNYSTGTIWKFSGDMAGGVAVIPDTVKTDLVLNARWVRTPIKVLAWDAMEMTYGETLGDAKPLGYTGISTVSCNIYDNAGISVVGSSDIEGRYMFDLVSAAPSVADSAVTRYVLWFLPQDSFTYKPDSITTVVRVHRRGLTVTPKTMALVLSETNELRASRPGGGGYLDVGAYLLNYGSRVNNTGMGYAFSDDINSILGLNYLWTVELLDVDPLNSVRYHRYAEVKSFREHVVLDFPSYDPRCSLVPCNVDDQKPLNYDVTLNKGNLWVTRISYMPPDSVVYGGYLPLNATHTFSQYTNKLTYYVKRYSENPADRVLDTSIVSVRQTNGVWSAKLKNVGRVLIGVTLAEQPNEEPPMPADTVEVEVEVVPVRGLGVQVNDMTTICGRPLLFDVSVVGSLVSPDNMDSLYKWGLAINTDGEIVCPEDGQESWYAMRPGGITGTGKYADWGYIGALLKVKSGGTLPQSIDWKHVVDTIDVGSTAEIWARAYAHNLPGKSREVKYFVDASARAAITDVPLHIEDGSYVAGDTAWTAQLRFDHAGLLKVTASQWGDTSSAGYKPVTRDTFIYIRKARQTVQDFINDTVLPVGAGLGLTASVTRGEYAAYELRGDVNSALLSGDGSYVQFIADAQGIVELCAYDNGNDDWEPIRVCRKVTIYDPDPDKIEDDYGIVDNSNPDGSKPDVCDSDDKECLGTNGSDGNGNGNGNGEGSNGNGNNGNNGNGTTDGSDELGNWDGAVLEDSIKDEKGIPDPKHYRLYMSCRQATLRFKYSKTYTKAIQVVRYLGTVIVKDTVFSPDDSIFSFTVVPPVAYDRVEITFVLQGDSYLRYLIDIEGSLPNTYIYYDAVQFPLRLEAVNDVRAHPEKKCGKNGCLKLYCWYRDSIATDKRSGVYYQDHIDSIVGHTFSVKAMYFTGEYVWICGKYIPVPEAASGMLVYPNPVSGRLTVRHSKLKSVKESIILVYSAGSGSLAASFPISTEDVHDGSVEVDLGRLPEGAYVVRFDGEAAIVVKK
jgi:hypothetical protein